MKQEPPEGRRSTTVARRESPGFSPERRQEVEDNSPLIKRLQRETTVAQLESLGATVVREVKEQGGQWTVLTDPEDNEFCVVEAGF